MLGQVVHKQGIDLERGYERAALVGRAGSIRVPVEEQAQVVAAARDRPQRLVYVWRDRLGIDAAEVRVALGMQLGDADPTTGEQTRHPRRSGAEERIHKQIHVRGAEAVQIDVAADERAVGVERVVTFDQAGRLGIGERPALDGRPGTGGDARLDVGQHLRTGCRARGRLDLEAVVGPGVVAGGDNDARRGPTLDYLERGHLRRQGVVGKDDRNPVTQHDLGGGCGEVLAGEAAVVGEDDAAGLISGRDHVLGHGLGTASNVDERVVVADLGAPAIGAKDDPGEVRRATRHDLWGAQSFSSSLAAEARLALASSSAILRTSCECSAEHTSRASGVSTTMMPRSPMVTTRRPSDSTRLSVEPMSRRLPKPTVTPGVDSLGASLQASRRAAQVPRSLQPTFMGTTATAPSREAGSMTA